MTTTLDEYLHEVDRWKQAAEAKLQKLSDAERLQRLRAAREQLERQLGESLREVAAPVATVPSD